MEILGLFPTAVGKFDMNRNFTEEEICFIKNQDVTENLINLTSSDKYILENDELKDLKNFIKSCVDNYFYSVYSPKQNTSLKITQSWCNYTSTGKGHHRHRHPNSFISGVIYPQADIETDKIYFYKEHESILETPVEEFNQFNSDSWWLPVFTGVLYIFPSYLHHYVETVEGKDTRISLSFNTFPVGNFGDEMSLTGLNL